MKTNAATPEGTFDRVLDFGGKILDNPKTVAQLVEAVRVTAEAVRTIAVSQVEREKVRAEAQKEITRIHSVRDVLLTYLDRSFDERRENFERLFGTLDRAVESGQVEVVAKTLESVVALASESPFKALADAATAHRVLKDKDRDWEL